MKIILPLFLFSSVCAAAVDPKLDPRLAKNEVQECVAIAKKYLYAGEVSSSDKEMELISACRDVEPAAVKAVADNMNSWEAARAETLIPVIRASRGRGVDKCYAAAVSNLRTEEYNSSEEAQAILKKCE